MSEAVDDGTGNELRHAIGQSHKNTNDFSW